MLAGVNDSEADAKALVRMIAGIPSKINLIPFNPWPGTDYVCSDDETIGTFCQNCDEGGLCLACPHPRGRDILAACGQLKSDSVRLRASQMA